MSVGPKIQTMKLSDLGWNDFFGDLFAPYRTAGLVPARVVAQHRDMCLVAGEAGELAAEVSGRFRHETKDRSGYPAVGDWVAIEPFDEHRGLIHGVLERRSAFVRKVSGDLTEAQVVAANIDTVFLVTGLDGDFNLRRIERYLTTAWDSGASPVIVLNKRDLCPDIEGTVAQVEMIALGAPILAVSARDGVNLEALTSCLGPGKTAALLGSSGAGKSTIINRLIGAERLPTAPVREQDSRGRHTTSRRELIALPGRGLLIDTPGMRELQLWADEESLLRAFGDVEELAASCRFKDCRHEDEPGCAVRQAVADGALDPSRFESYLKQRRELEQLALKKDKQARRQSEKEFGRKIAAVMKDLKLRKPSYR
jgi:ribosome biogenesis GTPase / thiamine phosphate phosphatase